VDEIGVSTITNSELQSGVAKNKNLNLNELRVVDFLSSLEILPYDDSATLIYGDIRLQCFWFPSLGLAYPLRYRDRSFFYNFHDNEI
jgi:hypothetical protein